MVVTRAFLFFFLLFQPNSTTTNVKPKNPQPQPPPPTTLNTTTTSTKKSEWIKNPNPPIALNQMCLIEEEEKRRRRRSIRSHCVQPSLLEGKKKKKEIFGFNSPAKLNLWSWLSLIHRWSFRSLWSISLTIQPGLNPIRRQSLISGLGSVRFTGKAWFLGWRETLLDGTKSKPNTGDHGLGVLRLLLWWWWRNWAKLEKGGKKEPDKELDKGRKKEKTEKERSWRKKEKEKSGRRKREDKVREM